MNGIETYLTHFLKQLEREYLTIAASIEKPIFIREGKHSQFRHVNQTDNLLCFLKGVKIISSLNSAVVLLEKGYTQEVGIICRCVDDYFFEIVFMAVPRNGTELSDDQKRFSNDFFQEQFENVGQPASTSKKRTSPDRKKIFAACARTIKPHLNPSDAQNAFSNSNKSLSGYVHGAYPHIMEMCGGNPPVYHMSGMLNTRRIREWQDQLVIYIERAITASILIAQKLQKVEVENRLHSLLKDYLAKFDIPEEENIKKMLATLKMEYREGTHGREDKKC